MGKSCAGSLAPPLGRRYILTAARVKRAGRDPIDNGSGGAGAPSPFLNRALTIPRAQHRGNHLSYKRKNAPCSPRFSAFGHGRMVARVRAAVTDFTGLGSGWLSRNRKI